MEPYDWWRRSAGGFIWDDAYNDWESYWNDVPKELVDTYGQIFPELTSGAECTEYYAHVNESYGDDWTSISSVIRFAAITYSDEEYPTEDGSYVEM